MVYAGLNVLGNFSEERTQKVSECQHKLVTDFVPHNFIVVKGETFLLYLFLAAVAALNVQSSVSPEKRVLAGECLFLSQFMTDRPDQTRKYLAAKKIGLIYII